MATAKVVYQNRETIADVTGGTAKATWQVTKLAGKGTAYVAGQVYINRDAIAGATVGAVKGTVGATIVTPSGDAALTPVQSMPIK
ncbi:hypothetical protein [Cupriavidus necator]|uniref:hypothetical protein n=1 Tax=Cupriavidus necator TaxID=106590 RepID=UPI003F740E95